MPPYNTGLDPFLARKHLVLDLGAFTANVLTVKAGFGVPPGGPSWRIQSICFSTLAAPSDLDGTMILAVHNNDISEGSPDILVTGFDIETIITPSKMFAATLASETAEKELTLEPGDAVTFRMTSDSAAIDSNPGIRCVVEYIVVPSDSTASLPTS